ncbi:hypothetical protein KGF86_13515 [Ornithinibacillus massiliensis]|uniref:Uncharacterized protein n=1 Tax=Ornithinibacillus massiliensis TaxID=1944633 RepID=A0ABS5MFV3_9BACI|nr:hypothetical protein [Ornithinibacillus massiliensis]MBS3681221.1 hypothetical protein [Ornithinibacillus massiliensis]
MDTFTKNYWSMYLDFLNDYKELTYRGYSLPYLCHFRSLVREKEPKFYKKDFIHHCKNFITDSREIQEEFNRYLNTIKQNSVKPKKGKIVFHDVYNLLRMPIQTFKLNFKGYPIIRLSEGPSPSLKDSSKQIVKGKPAQQMKGLVFKKIKNAKTANQTAISIPVDYFDKYTIDTSESVGKVKSKAKKIFQRYENHILYSNSKFRSVFFMQLTKIINRFEEAENFLTKNNVACVVVPSTHYLESRVLVIVAKMKGIPTICMQHGIISSEIGYLPKIAMVDAVHGVYEREWFYKNGAPDGSIEVIGHPRFDLMKHPPKVSREVFHQRLGIDPSKRTLLIAVRGNKNLIGWKRFIKALSSNTDLNIILKDYPTKESHSLTKIFPFVKSITKYKLYDILHNVDIVATYSSTVGLEAMILGKPVFILGTNFAGNTGYFSPDYEFVERTPVALAEKVRQYITNIRREQIVASQQEFLKHAYPMKFSSGNRLRKLLEKLIKE